MEKMKNKFFKCFSLATQGVWVAYSSFKQKKWFRTKWQKNLWENDKKCDSKKQQQLTDWKVVSRHTKKTFRPSKHHQGSLFCHPSKM